MIWPSVTFWLQPCIINTFNILRSAVRLPPLSFLEHISHALASGNWIGCALSLSIIENHLSNPKVVARYKSTQRCPSWLDSHAQGVCSYLLCSLFVKVFSNPQHGNHDSCRPGCSPIPPCFTKLLPYSLKLTAKFCSFVSPVPPSEADHLVLTIKVLKPRN